METRRRLAVLLAPPALWLAVLFLLPLGLMALFSFRAGTLGPAREVFTLDNYRAFLSNAGYQRLLWRSAGLAFVVAAAAVVLAYPLAHFLAFRAGARRLTLLTLIIAPAWTSYLLRILAWKVILGSGGVLNSLLLGLGLIHETLPILLYSRTAVVITLVYVWAPFVTLPIFAALERIDEALFEAAADLGAAPWETFLRVTLPLSLPGAAAGFFFVFIPTLGEYVTPLLVGGAQGSLFGNLIQDLFLRGLNWPMGATLSLVMLAGVLALIWLFSRLVRLADLVGL